MRLLFFGIISLFQLSAVFAQCDSVRSRPNIYTMPASDRDRFINAIKQINSGPRPTIWDRIIRKHTQYYSQIHSNPRFFAWHRIFVYELESELRRINPSIRVPYWDWTVYYNNMSQDPIWQWFGKNGNSNQGLCVTQGQFVGFQSYYYADYNQPGSNHCSRRRPDIPNVFTGQRDDIDRNVIDAPTPQQFWENMEYGSHAAVHNGISFDFSNRASPNDPLFWVHHSFIDKIWFDRQMRHGDWALLYPASDDTDLPGYTQRVRDVFDPSSLCYTYRQDNFSWETAPANARVAQIQADEPEPFTPLASIASGRLSDEAIDAHAKEYVLKDVLVPSNATAFRIQGGCELVNVRDPIGISYIRMMNYDESKVRTVERRTALFINELNRNCVN